MKENSKATPNLQLKREREQRNWSQDQLARVIGTTALNVSRWERGLTFPGPHFRQKLCELFGKISRELGLTVEEPEAPQHLAAPQALDRDFVFPLTAEFIYDSATPSSLATPRLVGRDVLLHLLKQQLRSKKELALCGLPGVGKTAIVVDLVKKREVLEYFRDGVLWAVLGTEPDIPGQLRRWGCLLGMASPEVEKITSIRQWAQVIHEAIGTRRLLLVVDDVWSIEDALAFRVGGPNCTHLITTRYLKVALQFSGEGATVIRELSEDEAVMLIAQYAPEAVTRESDEVHALVRSVGGLPLALSLMGKYLRMHTYGGQPRRLRTALQRLQHVNERLQLTQPQAPLETLTGWPLETPLSLQAVIDISDRHLDQEARYTLRALSVFPPKPNTFSEEAALAIDSKPAEILDALTDAGLLEVSGPGRYTLHPVIADYAMLNLEDAAVEERMVKYFINYVEIRQTDYDALELEINNVLAALQLASKRAMHMELVRGVNAFARFLQTRGIYALAENQLRLAEQATRLLNDTIGLITVLLNLGIIAERRGDYNQAEAYYQEGLALARPAEHPERIGALLTNLGAIAVNRGDHAQAEAFLQEALALAHRVVAHPERISRIYENMGAAAFHKGNYAQAEAYWRKALTLATQIGHRESISSNLENLGAVALKRGNYAQAEKIYRKALALARQIGYRERIGSLFIGLAELALRREDFVQAEAYAREGLSLARQIGHRERISLLLANLGDAVIHQGRHEQAESYLQEGLELARQIGHPWLICYLLVDWGALHIEQQQLNLASATFQEALQLAQGVNQELVASALYGLARVAAASGENDKARRSGQESLQMYTASGHERANKVEQWLAGLPDKEKPLSSSEKG